MSDTIDTKRTKTKAALQKRFGDLLAHAVDCAGQAGERLNALNALRRFLDDEELHARDCRIGDDTADFFAALQSNQHDRRRIAELEALLKDRDATIEDRDDEIEGQNAEIAELRSQSRSDDDKEPLVPFTSHNALHSASDAELAEAANRLGSRVELSQHNAAARDGIPLGRHVAEITRRFWEAVYARGGKRKKGDTLRRHLESRIPSCCYATMTRWVTAAGIVDSLSPFWEDVEKFCRERGFRTPESGANYFKGMLKYYDDHV